MKYVVWEVDDVDHVNEEDREAPSPKIAAEEFAQSFWNSSDPVTQFDIMVRCKETGRTFRVAVDVVPEPTFVASKIVFLETVAK